VQSDQADQDFATLAADLGAAIGSSVTLSRKDTHAILTVKADQIEAARAALARVRPGVRVMSAGESIEIYKEVGLPKDVAARFEVSAMSGRHGIGHTRMATESAI